MDSNYYKDVTETLSWYIQ